MKHNMKDCCKRLVHNFVYGKVNRNFYTCHQELLQQTNYATVRMVYLFSAFLCFGLTIYIFATEHYSRLRGLYVAVTVFLGIMAVLVLGIFKDRRQYVRILYYLFAGVIFFMAIMVGTVMDPDKPAVSFFVVLMILPLLFVEQPSHSIIMAALACAVFFVMSVLTKADYPDAVSMDVVDVFYCFPISAVFITYSRNMYLQYMQATIIFRIQSETDQLTGVSNKEYAENLCKVYLRNTKGLSNCALLIIDLDNFKYINDTLGHKQGDAFLNETGRLLKEIFCERDVVGRIGGDEFLVLMKEITDTAAVSRKALLIKERIERIFCDLTVTRFSCSIGIALSTREMPLEYHTMFFRADQALYLAKQKGKNQYEFYSEERSGMGDKPFMLVVDDSDVSRAILCSCFEEEYEVQQAEDGAQALEYMRKYNSLLSVVLLDIEMPVMNGYDVLKVVKADKSLGGIPILVVTADGANERMALELGAADMITKPFDPVVVKMRVSNARKLFAAGCN